MPKQLGGSGGTLVDAIKAVTELGNHSLAAAFCFVGTSYLYRAYYRLKKSYSHQKLFGGSANVNLTAGTGLSNALEISTPAAEELNVNIREENGKRYLNGRLPSGNQFTFIPLCC